MLSIRPLEAKNALFRKIEECLSETNVIPPPPPRRPGFLDCIQCYLLLHHTIHIGSSKHLLSTFAVITDSTAAPVLRSLRSH